MSKLKDEKGMQGIAPRLLCDAHLKREGTKWDRCVQDVKKKGKVDNAYAVCTKSVGPRTKSEADSEAKVEKPAAEDMKADDVNTLVVQNPNMNAPSFLNLLKSKGFKITKEAEMSTPALNRAKPKEAAAAITEKGSVCDQYISFRFVEGDSGAADSDKYQNRFRVVLIQEGLGNTKDGYYYTKDALKSAVPVFEGRKMYADHPSKMDEAIRPERSVRDVYGHFENVQYQEGEDSAGRLEADLVLLPDSDSDWVRARMAHAIQYSKKYPDKDFIGLSINASGDANPVDATEFAEKGDVVTSAKAKLSQAIADGLNEVKVVKTIDSAVSCDLVTEAGAKGKVLELLEAEQMAHKKEAEEKKHESEERKENFPPKKDADAKDKDGDDDAKEAEEDGEAKDHDDEDQDKALIMDQLKKHGLVKDGEDGDHEEVMKAAKHYQKAYMAAGHDAKEAAHRAVEAMKCAGDAHAAMESEKKEAEEKHHEAEEKHKESAELLKLRGENARLQESLASIETEKYLEKKLKESRLPMSVTKRFKESVKSFKNKKEVDEKFNLFIEGYRATVGGEAIAEGLDSCVVQTEKANVRESAAGESLDLADCVE